MSELKAVEINVFGKKPDAKELEQYSNLTYGSGLPGGEELKDALIWLGSGIGIGIFGFLFGSWVIRTFVGPGVLIFGYGSLLALPMLGVFLAVSSIYRLLRPAHKKKASKAFEWVWIISIMGDDRISTRFGKIPYAISTMRRIFPEGYDFSESKYKNYLNSFRNEIIKICDINVTKLKEEGWWESSPIVNHKIIEDEEINEKLHKIHAIITYDDQVGFTIDYQKNKKKYMTATRVEINVIQYYIKSGEYFFPYDYMPEFKVEN